VVPLVEPVETRPLVETAGTVTRLRLAITTSPAAVERLLNPLTPTPCVRSSRSAQ
jgi:hypothetical protein